MKNFYESRHYKMYIIIPVAMLLISLFFIPKIQLDSSLKGGISIQLITNSTIQPRALTALVDSKIPGAQSSVSVSPGGLSVTMAENTSIAAGQAQLLAFYNAYSNYTASTFNISAAESQLASQPGNSTLQSILTSARAEQAKSITGFRTALSSELADLRSFVGSVNYNTSDYANLPNVAKNSYTNATLVYQNKIISTLKTIIPFSILCLSPLSWTTAS